MLGLLPSHSPPPFPYSLSISSLTILGHRLSPSSFKPPPPPSPNISPLSRFPSHIFSCAVLSPALPSSSPLTYQRGQASLFCLKVTRSIWSCCRDTWGNLFAGGRCEETGVDSSGPLVTPDDPVKVATCCSYSWAATVCFKIEQTTCCNLI